VIIDLLNVVASDASKMHPTALVLLLDGPGSGACKSLARRFWRVLQKLSILPGK
jgi:hypothetical protein